MSGLLKAARRSVGPTRPVTVVHVLTLLFLAAATYGSYGINISIGDFYCGLVEVASRGACPGLRKYMEWHTIVIVLNIAMSVYIFIFRLWVLVVVIVGAVFYISSLTVLGLWVAAYFVDPPIHAVHRTLLGESAGVVANAIVTLVVLFYHALIAAYRRG